jgi:basic amino acid/polyamine antiporter, APA family
MFGYLAGDTLGASRILFAFGRDGLLPRGLAAVHPGTRAPHVAIGVHALAAALLAMTGSFAALAPIASVAIIAVYVGCCAAVLAMGERTGRLAAVVPMLAIAGLLWVISYSTVPEFLAVGTVLLVGSLVYMGGRRLGKQSPETPHGNRSPRP